MLSKVVGVVTGGASGLGAATVSTIVRNGGKVLVADLESQKEKFLRLATVVGAEAAANPSRKDMDEPILTFHPTDVTDAASVEAALDKAEEVFGEPINAAINCAGVGYAKRTVSQKNQEAPRVHPLDGFSNTLEVNTVGTFNVARLAAARMLQRDENEDGLRGCIINTASIAAFDGQIGQVAYAASKGAIVGMTLPLARDLATYKIRVMTIAPGLFLTPLLEGLPEQVQNDLGSSVPLPSRLGHPDEYGKLVSSILSNPMLNGEVIRLDGALRMPP